MMYPEFASYSDQEVADAYQWLKSSITADLKAGKDIEKYRTPLKEVGGEMNYRINRMLENMPA